MKPSIDILLENYGKDKESGIKELLRAAKTVSRSDPNVTVLYAQIITYYAEKDDMRHLLFAFEEYQKLKIKTVNANEIDIYGPAGLTYQKNGSFKKAVRALEHYRKLIHAYDNGQFTSETTPDLNVRKPVFVEGNGRLTILTGLCDALCGLEKFSEADNVYRECKLLENPDWDETLLTIGMIVKNEEKTLETCLSALTRLRERVKTELIIVDTGSTDKTVEIAARFADEVRHFEWTGDFSAARNESLRDAKGDWFMFIDADEVFADTAEIENFFLTGEYTAYNYGNFVIRNLEENGTYTEFSGPRLMRIFDTTKFIKPIHEYIPIVEPVKYFGAYVNHSGYVGSKGQKKAVRNFEKLHEEYEKNPNDPSVMLQLAFEYTHIDYDKAFEYLKQGIEVCGKNDEKIFEAVFYSVYARLLTEKGHFDKVYSELFDYMKHCDEISAVICTYIDLYAIYGRVCHKLGKNDEALKYFERYFAYYKLFESGELRTEDLMVESPIYVLPLSQKLAMLDYCDTLIALNEYKKAAAVSEQIPPPSEETNELADINRIIIIQKLMIMKLTGNYKPLIELFSDIFEYCKGDEIRDYFLGAVLHGIASANKPLDVIDTAIRAVRSLRTLPKDKLPEDTLPEDYELLLICLHDHYDSVHVSDEDIEKFLGQTEKLSYHCADLIPLMMIEGRSLNIVASRFDPTDYERLFTHFYVYDAVFEKILENYSGTPVFDTLNEDALILLAGCVLCSLENFKNEVESSPDMTSGIYVTLCDRYMQLAYPPEITTEENAEHIIMPIRPGYYLLMAYLHLQNKNAKENLRFLRKALSCRPDLKKYIRHETMMSKVYLI